MLAKGRARFTLVLGTLDVAVPLHLPSESLISFEAFSGRLAAQ